MADQEQPDDSGWRILFAPFGNLLLIGLLLYKLISLIVDVIDKRIHPENYKSDKQIGKIQKNSEKKDKENQ